VECVVSTRVDIVAGRERGQALVETALTMLIVLVLLSGMVDFGLAFGYRVALANASRGGARYGSRYPKMTGLITAATIDSLRGTLVIPDDYDHTTAPDEHLEIDVACENNGATLACSSADRGQQIRVTVSYAYQPLFGSLLGISEVPIASSTIMYILGPDEL